MYMFESAGTTGIRVFTREKKKNEGSSSSSPPHIGSECQPLESTAILSTGREEEENANK